MPTHLHLRIHSRASVSSARSVVLCLFAILFVGGALDAQGVVAPYVQPFEGVPNSPAALVGGAGLSTLGPAWDIVLTDPTSRVRVGNPGTQMSLAGYVPAPIVGQTGACMVLDHTAPGGVNSTEAAVLHINYAASNLGQGIVVHFFLRENSDETNASDVIAIQDGVTAGFGVQNTGAPTATAGYGGWKEVLLLDWNGSGVGSTWTEFSFTIDNAFLTTNFGAAAVNSNDVRIIFRQQDNFPLDGGDGLLIDQVRVHALQTTTGQAPQVGVATLDINQSYDLSGYPASSNRPGPYRSSIANGWGTFELSISGAANQPIVLLFGPLSIASAQFAGIGQVDIGIPATTPPYIPTGISIVVDGTQPGIFNSLFVTGASGQASMVFGMPIFPQTGLIGAFQVVVLTGGPNVVALSNAVELEIL